MPRCYRKTNNECLKPDHKIYGDFCCIEGPKKSKKKNNSRKKTNSRKNSKKKSKRKSNSKKYYVILGKMEEDDIYGVFDTKLKAAKGKIILEVCDKRVKDVRIHEVSNIKRYMQKEFDKIGIKEYKINVLYIESITNNKSLCNQVEIIIFHDEPCNIGDKDTIFSLSNKTKLFGVFTNMCVTAMAMKILLQLQNGKDFKFMKSKDKELLNRLESGGLERNVLYINGINHTPPFRGKCFIPQVTIN